MLKKAKKVGGGKGGAKTEEDRLMFLQQRAQAEEAAAKKKEEMLMLFLKDKLQKEQQNTAVNLLKLTSGWRSVLRKTRAAELRADVSLLSQTFERHLDVLDSVIQNLERDLREAERQSAQVRRVHLQQVERLWAQQQKRLMFVQLQWEGGLQHLSSRFSSERTQIQSHAQQQRADLEDATFTLEQQHKAVMTEIHRLYGESIASYQSSHEDRRAALVLKDKEKLKEQSLRNQEAVQLCSTESKALELLLSSHQRFTQTADADMANVKRLQDVVIQLRMKLNSSRTENQTVEEDLTAARNQLHWKTHALRQQLTEAQAAARRQLTELSLQSDNAAKELKAVIAKGERVLRVADMCRRLESEQQQVLVSPAEDQEGPGPEDTEPAQVWELQQVTRSISAAVLQRAALRVRRDHLSRENQQLRLLLRQRLDAMTVGGDALDGRLALLTVYQAPTAAAPPDTSRRHAVIEAVHVVRRSLQD